MRRTFDAPIIPPIWPEDIRLPDFTTDIAQEAHKLLVLSYQHTGIHTPPFSEWWAALSADEEYDPSLCFVIRDQEAIIGFAQCWTSAFIKDIVIHPRRWGQGFGTKLLLHIFAKFQTLNNDTVELKVLKNNLGAIRMYVASGMQIIERLPIIEKGIS